MPKQVPIPRRKLNPFDGFVLAGALVNIIVILVIVGYWVLYG